MLPSATLLADTRSALNPALHRRVGLPPLGPLLVGLVGRLVLAPYTSTSYDVSVWFHTSLSGFYGTHLYDRPGFSYPPVWGYFLQILGSVVRLVGLGPSFFGVQNPDLTTASAVTGDFSDIVTSPAFNLLFKSVLFCFDLGTGLLVYQLVELLTGDPRRARLAFVAWFLNPLIIYESAISGAADTLVGFFVLTTVILVLRGRPFWGGAGWVLGIATKALPAILVFQLVVALYTRTRVRLRSLNFRIRQVWIFAAGSGVAAIFLLAPEMVFGSLPGMLHNTLARTEGQGIVVGGLSLMGVRHLKPWSWLLVWSYDHSATVIRASELAEVVAIAAWLVWAVIVSRRNVPFALLTGTIGTLVSFMLLSPNGQPQYVMWWLPVLVVVVIVTGRGYWQLTTLTLSPLVFSVAILGPTAVLSPLATYTTLLPAKDLGREVMEWYLAPGRLWGTSLSDDFFAPAALATIVASVSLFITWVRLAHDNKYARADA